MIHLDLFSGIGGFAYAIDQVWDGVEHIFCEIDPYCRALLKLRFPKARIYGDIRKFITYAKRMRELQSQRSEQNEWRWSCDILTGGFPCQPFSQAGKRRGKEDDRYLWPQMFRVIRIFKPTWIIAENVRGILTIEQGLVFEQVCLDLEGEGYEVQPFVIPACAVNASHRRDRIWFVANNTTSLGFRQKNKIQTGRYGVIGSDKSYSDTEIAELSRSRTAWSRGYGFTNEAWNKNWLEVATKLCRMDDGLPAKLDGLKLSKSKHRVERLKALGNSIVPQVAIEILKAIKSTMEESC
jgi:DNA (cytosine-5)-methyltransferase 1